MSDGLYDPNKHKFDVNAAEMMLGIDANERNKIRMAVASEPNTYSVPMRWLVILLCADTCD